MTDLTIEPRKLVPSRSGRPSLAIPPQAVFVTVALCFSGVVGLRVLDAPPAPAPLLSVPAASTLAASTPAAPVRTVVHAPGTAARPLIADTTRVGPPDLLSPLGWAAPPFAQNAPLASTFVFAPSAVAVAAVEPDAPPLPRPPLLFAPRDLVADAIPLPLPRPLLGLPAEVGQAPVRTPGRPLASRTRIAAGPAALEDHRSFFEKIFGGPPRSGAVLAYAAPEDGVLGITRSLASGAARPYGPSTAIYDIAAHTVYMPNGERLEAHSGLGDLLDDPRRVSERNRGPTPPAIYELTPREQLFHGVQALRLTPVGGGSVFGRTGLLAHTYMLGPNGDSNGCVSFRNYNAFLQAFMNGEVRRLVVVARQI